MAVSHELVPENSSRAEDDPGFYTVLNNMDTYKPAPSTRVAISRVVRSSLVTKRVADKLVGIDYTSSLNISRKRRMNSEAQQTSSTVNKKSKKGAWHIL